MRDISLAIDIDITHLKLLLLNTLFTPVLITNVAIFFYMPKNSSCKINTCRILITLVSHWQSLNCDVDSKRGGLETINKTNLQTRAKDNKKAPKILNPRGFALVVSGPDETRTRDLRRDRPAF